jgi:hypothetical protein
MYKDYAFIIGIDDYIPEREGGPKQLDAAKRDAREFEEWFLKESEGDPKNKFCKSVYSKRERITPIHCEVEEKLDELLDEARKDPDQNRRLYFYFAGHGLGIGQDPTNNALCMADWSARKPNRAISSREYHDLFLNFGLFRQVVILLDCCRDIKMRIKTIPPGDFPAVGSGPHQAEVFIGYAAKSNNPAYEITIVDGEKRGVFTYVLLNGLRGGAADDKGNIASCSLKKYLIKYVPEFANEKQYAQIPDINDGLTDPDSIFATLPAVPSVDCIISFKQKRTGPVMLVDKQGKIIHDNVEAFEKEFTIHLKKGIYLLKDIMNNDEVSIDVEGPRFSFKERPHSIAINF